VFKICLGLLQVYFVLFDRGKALIRVFLFFFTLLFFFGRFLGCSLVSSLCCSLVSSLCCLLVSSLCCLLSWLFFSSFLDSFSLFWWFLFFCGYSPLSSPICWRLSSLVSINKLRRIIQNLIRIVELKFREGSQTCSSSLNEDFLRFLKSDLRIADLHLHEIVGEFLETDCFINYLKHKVRFSRSASSLLTFSSFFVMSSYYILRSSSYLLIFSDTWVLAEARWRNGYLCFSASLILSTKVLIYLIILVF